MSTETLPLDTIAGRTATLGDPDTDMPAIWTPEHVVKRLIEALQTLRFATDRGGPRSATGGWPPGLIAAAKARDAWLLRSVPQQVLDNLQEPVSRDKDGFDAQGNPLPRYAPDLPGRTEIALMEEALGWPITYLTSPLEADALSLYLMGKAHRGFEVKEALAVREKQQALRSLRQWVSLCLRQDREAHILIHDLGCKPDTAAYEALTAKHKLMIELYLARREIRARIAPQVNQHIKSAARWAVDEALNLRTEAEHLIMRECLNKGLAPEGFEQKPPRPPHCTTRWEVDWYRKGAAQRIAEGLNAAAKPIS